MDGNKDTLAQRSRHSTTLSMVHIQDRWNSTCHTFEDNCGLCTTFSLLEYMICNLGPSLIQKLDRVGSFDQVA